ncbi:MAG: MBL fold metallo-hydrolase [Phyllobacteriaceae bacterium]|nr:MBL fold metallo-hydrolase [Phyllobacteriaceae bacterium]
MVTRRTIIAGMASLPLAGLVTTTLVQAQDSAVPNTLSTSAGDVTVHPVNHASLVLEWDGKGYYLDPVGGGDLYAGLPAPAAILITHGHGDHFDLPTLEAIGAGVPIITTQEVFDKLPEAFQANATVLANGDSGEIAGVPVRAIAAHNITEDRMRYHPVGVGNGYVLSFADKQVYVAGDTEPTDDMLALTEIAMAFLPMNLPFTMTPEQALEAANTFKPAILYPYHYGESDLSPLQTGLADGIELRMAKWY